MRRRVRGRSVLLATTRGRVREPPGAFRAGAARRRPLHLARTCRAPHPAPGDLFVAPAMAMWALLPLIASQRLGLGAAGYGALFGALRPRRHHRCHVAGTREGPPVHQRDADGSRTLYAATSALIVLIPSFPAALVILVLAGLAWMAVTSTLAAELQLFLPAWVRARGFAIYMVIFTGSMTVGALHLGTRREAVGLQLTFLVAAVLLLAASSPESCAGAGDRPPRPRAGHLLAGGAAGLRSRARHRTRPGDRRVHRHAGAGGGVPGGDGPPAPLSTPNRRDAAGSCTGTAIDRTASSRSSASRRGRNTCASTVAA